MTWMRDLSVRDDETTANMRHFLRHINSNHYERVKDLYMVQELKRGNDEVRTHRAHHVEFHQLFVFASLRPSRQVRSGPSVRRSVGHADDGPETSEIPSFVRWCSVEPSRAASPAWRGGPRRSSLAGSLAAPTTERVRA